MEIARVYIVNTENWKKAANDICQPYWDCASNTILPPQVISQKQVTITNNIGKLVRVDNPLYHYKFHPIDSFFPTTFRLPTSEIPMLQTILMSFRSMFTCESCVEYTDGIFSTSTLSLEQSNITMNTYKI